MRDGCREESGEAVETEVLRVYRPKSVVPR